MQYRIEFIQEYLYNFDIGFTDSGIAGKSADEWRKDTDKLIERIQEEMALLEETINLIEEQFISRDEVKEKYVLKKDLV